LVRGHHKEELWKIELADADKKPQELDYQIPLSLPSGDPTKRNNPLRSAFQHPDNPDWFVVVIGDWARVFEWRTGEEQTTGNGIKLDRSRTLRKSELMFLPRYLPIHRMGTTYHVGPGVVLEFQRPDNSRPPCLTVFPSSAFNPKSRSHVATSIHEPNVEAVCPAVFSILGLSERQRWYFSI